MRRAGGGAVLSVPREPLLELLAHTFSRVSVEKGRTRLSFHAGSDDDTAVLEIASRATLLVDRGQWESGSRAFVRELKRLLGETVVDVRYTAGDSIMLTFGKEGELMISLKTGDFEGDVAASLQVEGMDFVSYHDDGVTRLSLRPREERRPDGGDPESPD